MSQFLQKPDFLTSLQMVLNSNEVRDQDNGNMHQRAGRMCMLYQSFGGAVCMYNTLFNYFCVILDAELLES